MSPTNLIRKASNPGKTVKRRSGRASSRREILIRAGSIAIRARLLDTPTADRIWATLPIYSTAETWGALLRIETHAETGLEPGARATLGAGEIAYWVEQDRILIGFGATPISRPGEIRLPSPCNIWATALDDVTALSLVAPGERVAILEADS